MPETITKKLTSIQTNFLKKFAEKLDNFGVVAGPVAVRLHRSAE